MSLLQTVLVIAAAATWLIGANLLVIKHRERLGWPVYSSLLSKLFPFKNFNDREALILLGLFVLTFAFAGLAAVLGP